MTARVLAFPTGRLIGTDAKVAARRVLAGARAANLTDVVVLRYGEDGEIYASSSEGPGDTLWLIEHAKAWILEGCPSD